MLMPPQPTEAEFFNRVLEWIDAPSAGYWTGGPKLRTSAIRLLREIGARVLVIDEINSVLAGTPGNSGYSCSCYDSCRMISGWPWLAWVCLKRGTRSFGCAITKSFQRYRSTRLDTWRGTARLRHAPRVEPPVAAAIANQLGEGARDAGRTVGWRHARYLQSR